LFLFIRFSPTLLFLLPAQSFASYSFRSGITPRTPPKGRCPADNTSIDWQNSMTKKETMQRRFYNRERIEEDNLQVWSGLCLFV